MIKDKGLLLRLIPILLVAALTMGLSNMLFQNMVADSTENCWDELAMVQEECAREISIRLNNNIKMLNMAADALVMKADIQNNAEVRDYLADVMHKTIFDRIDVVFPDGSVLVQATGERIADNGEKTYDELFAKGAHLSPRVSDFVTGKAAIRAFSPIYDAYGRPVAILCGTIYCTTLGEVFTFHHYDNGVQLFLVDMRDGSIVLDKLHEEPGSIYDMMGYSLGGEHNGADIVSDIMAGKSGRLDYVSQRYDQTSYTVYAPVQDTDFAQILVVQEGVLFAEANAMKSTLIRVGSAEFFLLVFFAIWIYLILRRSVHIEGRAKEAELALLQQKEQELERQYAEAATRQEFLEAVAENLPGGYHRCTTDHSFRLTFISKSFTEITGYTMEQLEQELDGSYMGIVAPEDRDLFLSLAPQLERDGHVHCAYRIRRRDGQLRWVQDSTQYLERDGQTYYQCALMDISHRVQELEKARQDAEASSRAKSTFLFNISHDIRTPMNAIKGFSHIIHENAENTQLVRQTISKIQQASDSLMMLMNDVLDISRIERGKERLDFQSLDLLEHTNTLYAMFAEEMHSAGIQFEILGEHVDDWVYCDHLKMTRIMMNLLSNAKKFTPRGGRVSFGITRLSREGDRCTYRFFVRDTGIGMSQEFIERAFDQFERERTSTQSGISGSGLGLSIVKMMAELMGGTVSIQSELGKGTEISVTISFQLARKEMAPDVISKPQTLDMTGKRLLVVEDNAFNREIAKYVLESMNFIVEEAENGAVCMEKLLSSSPDHYDLILMDIQMPIMDGYAATEKIRSLAEPQYAAIPIIAMTANAFEEDKRKCLEVGMNAHVGKPIDVNELIQVLSQVL